MPVDLAHSVLGNGPPLIILHGLFGSKRNWAGVAKGLADRYQVFCLDVRNHGDSPWADGMDYESMADDVRAFMQVHGLKSATVIGHSMGGKTAMTLALLHGDMVDKLIVVDIAPVPTVGEDVRDFLDILIELPLAAFSTRAQVDDHLAEAIPEAGVRSFLLQNLVRDDDHLRWRVNLVAIADGMDDITGFPDLGSTYDGPALFIAGGNSDYIQPGHHAQVTALFPSARIETISAAGHWVHAEQPEPFLNSVNNFLENPNMRN